jgi:hypothetical protein
MRTFANANRVSGFSIVAWLQEIAARILSDSRPQYLRAIDLFEFQVAVLFPDDDKMVNDARLFCAIKLLEHVAALNSSRLTNPPRLVDLAAIPDYSHIFDEVIFPNGGLKKIRFLENARAFDTSIEERWGYSKDVADIAQYTLRAHLKSPAAKQMVGKTAAFKVLAQRNDKSPETYKARWQTFQQSGTAAAMLSCFPASSPGLVRVVTHLKVGDVVQPGEGIADLALGLLEQRQP